MEYQNRGIQHFHIPIWVDGAPIIGINTQEEVTAFITKYVSCQIPDAALSPILYGRVIKHQLHHCNSYCLRSKKKSQVFLKYVGLDFQDLRLMRFICVVL